MSLGEAAARLLEDRRVQVILEPGDSTQYNFIIAPIALTVCNFECLGLDALFVGRTLGLSGDLVASAIIPDPSRDEWQYERAVEELSMFRGKPGNEWCLRLFDWWLRKLWERINQ
jgi:hypothetical protein